MEAKAQSEALAILQKCAEIEYTLGKMYDLFAAAFRENRDISKLFEKTAGEERNHEYQIQLAIRSFTSGIESMNITREDTEKHHTMALQTLSDVEHSMPGIEDAIKLSIRLEETFCQFHMDKAVQLADTSCGKLFSAMMAADESHIDTLKNALVKLA